MINKKNRVIGVIGVIAIILSAFIVIFVNGNKSPNVSPYSEKGDIHASLQTFPFNESVKKSDFIAKVQISKKIRELHEPNEKTIFEAKILGISKNYNNLQINQTINVMQMGNSICSFNENKLFQENETYILFLKKSKTVDDSKTFWILGEETNYYKIEPDGTAIKMSLTDAEITDIEDKEKTEQIKSQKNKVYNKDIQVVKENLLTKKIKDIVSEKNKGE